MEQHLDRNLVFELDVVGDIKKPVVNSCIIGVVCDNDENVDIACRRLNIASDRAEKIDIR